MRRFPAAVLPALLLAGCSTTPVHRAGMPVRLVDCPDWELVGRIGVRRAGEGWHGTLVWRQAGLRYHLRLEGPLGQGGLEVEGGPKAVRIRPAQGRPLTGHDLDALVARMLGWSLPVSGLRFWVRGRPAPGGPAHLARDRGGRPRSLRQQGWVLHYDRWAQNGQGAWYPARIRAARGALRVRLVVRRLLCRPQQPVGPWGS
ncbi:MAG: outer membrane lipoprotein LolB [Gammaproteobacteria bacterium]|nr:MAG: outer membrane lipoprotein LolB [Gammaproteobacteria bacterium]